jgi:nucleotide-binding universal stress UspA family protein
MNQLPYRPQPATDESPFGFLFRLAATNFIGLGQLQQLVGASSQLGMVTELVARDRLAALLDISPSEVGRWLYLARPGPDGLVSSTTVSIGCETVRLDHIRRDRGQICPECLKVLPYHRRLWDLTFVKACPEHAVLLVEACDCGARLKWPEQSACSCGKLYSELKTIKVPWILAHREIAARLQGGSVMALGSDRQALDAAFQAALLGAGRPVLAVPIGEKPMPDFSGPAAIAWNASREGLRAVASALPLLRCAREVVVLHAGDWQAGKLQPILDYLAWHGIAARGEAMPSGEDQGQTLLDEASRLGCELFVMGGYTHSRARERLFGDVTRSMLHQSDIPLWLSH